MARLADWPTPQCGGRRPNPHMPVALKVCPLCEHLCVAEFADQGAEVPLHGGDINPVVRIGNTIRRPREPDHVRQLLLWFEQVGFEGAPHFLGDDEQGREILSFVEGEPGFAPVPSSDEVIIGIGELLRRAHDAQEGFAPPGQVVAHMDLFWTNVVFRDGRPFALIDWELARPATRTIEVALAATYWAGLRIDEQLVEWGILLDRRGERLRLLCDAYGLARAARASLLDELIAYRRQRIASGKIRGTTPIEVIEANLRWTEQNYAHFATFLA